MTRNDLGLELACPHCAKVVPVPWEEIAAEAPNRASIAESPTPIPQVISPINTISEMVEQIVCDGIITPEELEQMRICLNGLSPAAW